jgi:hypothetical protein
MRIIIERIMRASGPASSFPGLVIPAQAGIQFFASKNWIPAFAGMTR